MLVSESHDFFGAADGVFGARRHRCLRPFSDSARGDFIAQRGDGFGGRADPRQSRVDDLAGEVGVF